MSAKKAVFIYVTTPNLSIAKKIGTSLVKNRLAACVNILPKMHSIYQWQNKTHSAKECVVIVKAPMTKYKKIETQILKLHPYECPCIVALPVKKGLPQYVKWLTNE